MAANLKPESWRHKKIVELAEYQKILVKYKNIAKGTTDPGVDCFDQ